MAFLAANSATVNGLAEYDLQLQKAATRMHVKVKRHACRNRKSIAWLELGCQTALTLGKGIEIDVEIGKASKGWQARQRGRPVTFPVEKAECNSRQD